MSANRPPSTFRELLERYESGERDFRGSKLDEDPNCDLSGRCLDDLNLSKSFVVADFQGASLQRARFSEANAKTCDFRNADLRDADFRDAALCAADFQGANIAGADFTGADLMGSDFTGAYSASRTFGSGEFPDW
jgi:uncharacterized protein YjbI with pentapeptide repeats